MASILITGSTQGVGLNAAKHLLDEGHGIILHAGNTNRAESFCDLARKAKGTVIGDLSLDLSRNCAAPLKAYCATKKIFYGTIQKRRISTRSGSHCTDQWPYKTAGCI